jgi:hypothetical protein
MIDSRLSPASSARGLFLLILCTIGTPAAAGARQSESPAEPSPLEAWVEARLDELLRERDFSGSILIAQDGRPLVVVLINTPGSIGATTLADELAGMAFEELALPAGAGGGR